MADAGRLKRLPVKWRAQKKDRRRRNKAMVVRLGANSDRVYKIDRVRGQSYAFLVRRYPAEGNPIPLETGSQCNTFFEAVELLKRYEQSLG